MNKILIKKIIFVLIILLAFFGINYFMMIPLNLRYTSVFGLCLLLVIFIYLLFSKKIYEKKYLTIGREVIETKIPNKKLLYIIIGAIVMIILHSVSSTPLLFSKQYQSLIGEVAEKSFTEDFTQFEVSELPIVDTAYAEKLGDKKLGSDRGLGSEYHVGEFSDIVVNGKMVMVAPLEFNGFFKWLNNKTTPGYVKVDKVSGEVELVTKIADRDLKLKYLKSAYFQSNLKRHTYFNGNMDNQLAKFTFELDDAGNPYYVVTKTHKTIGINGGDDVKSVVLVNVQTGEVKEYTPSEVPDWVDTIYPKEIVLKQLDDWGYYVNGFFNTLFSEKDIVRVTAGSRRIYNEDQLFHYTGMTSSGADESTVGFAFINTRTKQTTFYKMVGATEQAAERSAEGKVENYGYQASFPIPINVSDEATFFVTLKDSSGLIKQYAFVNIEDYSIVANGSTIDEALTSYLAQMKKEVPPDMSKSEEVSGSIRRIGYEIKDGNTIYYFMLKDDNTLYWANASVSSQLNITVSSDRVRLKHVQGHVTEFENKSL